MNQISPVRFLVMLLSIMVWISCGNASDITPLSEKNINLIFVVSPDLEHNTSGDIDKDTANLTPQGLNRSLQMASYLKEKLLRFKNATSIYTLAPMTHLQTDHKYPDMTSIGYIQQFALLNRTTLDLNQTSSYSAYTLPIKASYPQGSVPENVSMPSPFCSDCFGLDFKNTNGSNDALVSGIIKKNQAGFYVFSAPWETIYAMMHSLDVSYGNTLNVQPEYKGSNHIYAISFFQTGDPKLMIYNSQLNPSNKYPVLPKAVVSASCNHTLQPYFYAKRSKGVDGVVVPSNANQNQTVYIVRHAEAHPDKDFKFENGNYVAAGQWRALDLSRVLRGKINPDMVYSIDPAQWYHDATGKFNFSYVRPSLTVWPFVIANNLPYFLVSEFQLMTPAKDPETAKQTSNFFFTGEKFSDKTILLAWESGHIRPLLKYLLASYGGTNVPELDIDLPNTGWPGNDYDTIWRVRLDKDGNLTVDNEMCEGIESDSLPTIAPIF